MSGNDTQKKIIETPAVSKDEALPVLELSSVEADEKALETGDENAKPILEAESEKAGAANLTTLPIPTSQQVKALKKDQVTVEVENILEQGLKDIYGSLPEDVKPEFKRKGEETAKAISEMLRRATVRLGEIMKLILAWLKIIPSTNRFYLEQEAKIKADRIMVLSKEMESDKQKP